MNESEAFEKEGLEFIKKGLYPQALESFVKAVNLNPFNYKALRNLLFTAHSLGLTQDAIKTIEDLLKEHPSDVRMLAVAQEYLNFVHRKSYSAKSLTTIIMSKDRPMQLLGCLESLLFHSGIKEEEIVVLYKESGHIYYDLLVEKFPKVRWVREKKFSNDIQTLFNESGDFIFMCCDDVLFTESFTFKIGVHALDSDPDIFNFTLRLGKNINPLPEGLIDTEEYLKWKWYNPNAVRWYYPWSVSVSLYRKEDVLRLTTPFVKAIENPNFLESTVAHYLELYPNKVSPFLASFHHSKGVATQVNRVQNTHCNAFDGSKNTETDELYRLFLQGIKIDWEKIIGVDNPDFNLGAEYFELKKDESTSPGVAFTSLLKLLPFDNPYTNFNVSAFPKDWGDSKEILFLDPYLEETSPRTIVAVGIREGSFAAHLGSFLRSRSLDGVVFCIDTWLGSSKDMIEADAPNREFRRYYQSGYPFFYYQFLANMMHSGFRNQILPFPNASHIALKWFKYHKIYADFVYLSDTIEEDLTENLKKFWQILRPGGIMAGENGYTVGADFLGSVKAFSEEEHLVLETIHSGWVIRKPSDLREERY